MGIALRQMLKILLILSWIILIGLCIEAGAFIVNAVFALAKPTVSMRLWQQIDLSDLFRYDQLHFSILNTILGLIAVMKAWLFFLIVSILQNKELSFTQPFSRKVQRFVLRLSFVALLIGLLSWAGIKYTGWLAVKDLEMPDTLYLRLGGADVWMFMAVVLFIIAQIFQRGTEMQSEQELTV